MEPHHIAGDGPPHRTDSATPIFFSPPANQPLYDFALVEKVGEGLNVVHLFQVTVSTVHEIHMGTLTDLVNTFGAGNVHFYMIRVAICPQDYKDFKTNSLHVRPHFSSADDLVKFVKSVDPHSGQVHYHDCLWRLYSAVVEMAQADVSKSCKKEDNLKDAESEEKEGSGDVGSGDVGSGRFEALPRSPANEDKMVMDDNGETWKDPVMQEGVQ
jgi:hypothetical protein